MIRSETWEVVSTMAAPAAKAEAPVNRPQSSFVRGLSAVFGAIGVMLLVPIYIVALPVALMWRAILQTTVWSAWPRWSVWK